MGKNRRSVFKVLDTRTNQYIEVDSREEILVWKWLIEAQRLGIVKDFTYQPRTFQLSDAVKYMDGKKEKTLFREHCYSPDFLIRIDTKWTDLSREFKYLYNTDSIYVDVKGNFNITNRSFQSDRKWMFQKYGIYIYELKPKEFFRKFGILPEMLLTEKTKKPSKVFEGYPLITNIFKISAS